MMQFMPVYGKHYGPGYSGFSYYDGTIISPGISWLESVEEAQMFLFKLIEGYSPKFSDTYLGRPASHSFKVVDETTLIESSGHGVEYSHDLQDRIADPRLRLIFRKPQRLNPIAVEQMLKYAAEMEKEEQPYDYTGLVGAGLKIISPFNKIIPALNLLPNPLSFGGKYCTAFDADCSKHTDEYKNERIFRLNHVTRITPVVYWHNFPWKPLHYDRGY